MRIFNNFCADKGLFPFRNMYHHTIEERNDPRRIEVDEEQTKPVNKEHTCTTLVTEETHNTAPPMSIRRNT